MKTLDAIAVSKGVAIGNAFHYTPFTPEIMEETLCPDRTEAAVLHYQQAHERAAAELKALAAKLEAEDPAKAAIFEAHLDVLFDDMMGDEIKEKIAEDRMAADWAIKTVYEKYEAIIGASKNEMIRERAADIKDVKTRLLRCNAGKPEENLSNMEKPAIIIAHDLSPSDTATLDRAKVLAIVTEIGGYTSHSAIIARSYQIPAILGAENAMTQIKPGEPLIVDAQTGKLILEADEETVKAYEKKREDWLLWQKEVARFVDAEPQTRDGTVIEVSLNVSGASDAELEGGAYADGVGLFRTEFLYLGRRDLPDEEEQFTQYKKILLAFGQKPVIIRTIDLGGDKMPESVALPAEDNPFLGNRGIRLCLTNENWFCTQIRALLRASLHGNLWIMLPMIASLDEIRRAKAMIQAVQEEFDSQGVDYSKDVKIGIMIEVPAIAMLADLAAEEVDFASIGTNDLFQYTLAVDRMNPLVSSFYQPYHPGVLRLMGQVAEAFEQAGKPLSVCGEMGGDVYGAALLMGLGIRKLSMGFPQVAEIKKLMSEVTIEELGSLAKEACASATSEEVEHLLKKALS